MTYTVSSGTLNSTIPYHTGNIMGRTRHSCWHEFDSWSWCHCVETLD